MPACATCHEVSGGKNLNNAKCQECLKTEFDKTIANQWVIIEQHRQNSEMCERECKEFMSYARKTLAFLESLLGDIEAFDENTAALQCAISDLQTGFEAIPYPHSVNGFLSYATCRSENVNTGKHRDKGHGDLELNP